MSTMCRCRLTVWRLDLRSVVWKQIFWASLLPLLYTFALW